MSKKRVLSYIIGSNGAGKSTLARNVLGPDIIHTKIDDLGYLSLSEYNIYKRTRPRVVGIGRYTSDCGGVDTLKPLSNVYRLGKLAADKFEDANILMESLLMSGLFSSPLKFFLSMKYDRGFDVEVCFLFASLRESLQRVFVRNGGKPIKPGNVESKLKSAIRNYQRFVELKHFRCIAIDTTKLTSDQVFSEFRHWSGLYEH